MPTLLAGLPSDINSEVPFSTLILCIYFYSYYVADSKWCPIFFCNEACLSGNFRAEGIIKMKHVLVGIKSIIGTFKENVGIGETNYFSSIFKMKQGSRSNFGGSPEDNVMWW